MPAESPRDLFERAIAGASNDELLEAWVRIIGEACDRIANYCQVVEDGAQREVGNEAVVFASRAEAIAGIPRASRSRRSEQLVWEIRGSHRELLALVEEGAHAG